ncbi:MAG: ATP-binding cassette domain-containing protein [Calditrichaeota bacterium]|nr:MAG: ATP-binding cassette domain-containing protein [Calditrichota bacterium]
MISFSSKRPVTVAMLALGLCLLGVISWNKLAVQLLPEFIMPEVFIGAGLQGASPLQIERDLVIPIEGEISQLENVHDINSSAGAGFASIQISFNHGTDMKFTLLKLQQRINAVQKLLPAGSTVRINHFDSADLSSYLMQLNIRGESTLEALRETAERRVRPRLEQVDGIVNVRVGGGQRKNVGIEVDKDKCEARNISILQVQQKINAFHRQPQQAGRIVEMGKMWDIIVDGRVDDLRELQNLIVRSDGPVYLRDVATIGYSQEEQTSIYRVNGKSSVGIMVQKDNTSNMLSVASAVLEQIETLNLELESLGYELVVGFNQAQVIQEAIDRVKSLALTGAFLALLVLFLFLRNVRFVLILMAAIPISLLVTFNLMFGYNLSINILSLCGLALAIGMLVDNGIVVMENIFSHFQKGKNAKQAAFDGTKEMARSIFAATGTTILVFLPVLFIESDAQLFIRELALSIIFPLAVSLVVALSIIPLLAGFSLKIAPDYRAKHSRAAEIYRIFLKSVLRHRIRTVSGVILLLLISLFIGVIFIMDKGEAPPPERIEAFITMPRGSTLARTDEVVENLEKNIAELKDVDEFRSNIQEEEASITLDFKPPNEREEELNLSKIKQKIKRWNRRFRDTQLTFDQKENSFGGRTGRGMAGGFLGGESKALVLRGHDLQKLQMLNRQIIETLKDQQDIEDESVRSAWRGGMPELQIRGDRIRLAMWGLSMREIMQTIWTTRKNGANSQTPFNGEQGEVNINLRYKNIEEARIEDVSELKVMNSTGALVPLREVATIRTDEGEGSISRHNQEREIRISYAFRTVAEQAKTRLEQAESQVDRLVRDMRLPKGFTLEKEKEDESRQPYYWMLGIGTLLIFMFLAAQFESFFGPFVILGTIPTAIIGALFTLAITGTPLTLGSGAPMALLGLIVLLGIVVNNGIILLDRIAVLRTHDNYSWQRAIIIAGQSRVRPIIMTSVTTVLGVFPLALKQGMELEIWPPFALTVIGGLTVSALSTLLFIPVLYVGFEQIRVWLKNIGWPFVAVASVITYGIMLWYFQHYNSILYTSLLVLPVWFSILGLIYAGQSMLRIKQEKARLAASNLTIEISNLTKIYGTPGRLVREWQKNRRRETSEEHVRFETKPSGSRDALKNSTIWVVAVGILLIYLHFFFTSGLWIAILSILSLLYLFSVRPYWYRWRFHLNRPSFPSRFKFISGAAYQDKEKRTPFTYQNYQSRGGTLFVLSFLIYFFLRTEHIPVTVVFLVFTLLLWRLNKISMKIQVGEINPELPSGRFRRIKRVIYVIVQNFPFIKPPKPQVHALRSVNLKIQKGMFGLLGPNGAGKTTLMRILVGVLQQNRGSIKINGLDLDKHREIFHGSIGYLPQDFGLYENMTPEEYLNYYALTNGIYEKQDREQRIENILQSVGLWDRRNDKVKTFSGGMKQRVGIAQTLLHLPSIIVVDEPTAGLDPRERIRFRNLLSELAKERIVVFSTHIIEDISSTCKDLAVLNGGRVIFRGSPEQLQNRARGLVYEAMISEDRFAEVQQSLNLIQHNKTNDGIYVRFISISEPAAEIQTRSVEPNLEDAYLYLLQKEK